MRFTLNDKRVPDRSVLLLDITYENQTSDKVWSYVLVKANGRWFGTGNGAPYDASWPAVMRWLERDGRVLRLVQIVTESRVVWSADDTETDGVDPLAIDASGDPTPGSIGADGWDGQDDANTRPIGADQ